MPKKILLVDDEPEILEISRDYLKASAFDVVTASDGVQGLAVARREKPDLIVLDWMMPEMDGLDLCREIRRESNVPIIMLTSRSEEADKLIGLELGADDYITKPFDIEELKLRVGTAIRTHQRLNMTNPTTGLPSSRLIEEQLRTLMRANNWTYIQIGIDHLGPFSDKYGFVAGDEVLRFGAFLLNEIDDQLGTLNDFIGHAGGDTFVLITLSDNVPVLVDKLRQRFNEDVLSHYDFLDREQGAIQNSDGSFAPFMSLSIGVVSSQTQRFADIREITETAAELRRLDQIKQAKLS